jgi:hypothetical protein
MNKSGHVDRKPMRMCVHAWTTDLYRVSFDDVGEHAQAGHDKAPADVELQGRVHDGVRLEVGEHPPPEVAGARQRREVAAGEAFERVALRDDVDAGVARGVTPRSSAANSVNGCMGSIRAGGSGRVTPA